MRPALTAAAPALEQLNPRLALSARIASGWKIPWGPTCAVLDTSMIAAAIGATVLGSRASGAEIAYAPMAAFALLCIVSFGARGLYTTRLRLDILDDARTLLLQIAIAAAVILSLVLVMGTETAAAAPSVDWVARLWAFSSAYVVAGRTALYVSQIQARKKGEVVGITLVVGSGARARLTARRLIENRNLGLLPVGFVETGAEATPSRDGDLPIPIVGSTAELPRLVERYEATQVVVVASDGTSEDEVLPAIRICETLGVAVAYVPAFHENVTSRLRVEHVGGLPLVTAFASDPKGWQFVVKYALDRVLAGVALLALAPVLVAAAVAVWVSMGRPIFFRQVRIGLDGKPFEILKFRSMRDGAPQTSSFVVAEGTAPGGVEGDDRRTRVGTFLRKSSIDELPQLLNVLKGDMSLVGPRPERPEFVDRFNDSVHRYQDRHRVKSGITGWSQVHGLRGKTSIADRAEWDNFYVENFSLWLDVKIMLMTVVAVFSVFKTVE